MLGQLGQTEEARRLISAVRAEVAERGGGPSLGILSSIAADIEAGAGDPAAAVALGNECAALFEEAGERGWLSTMVAVRGDAHYRLGDVEQAEADAITQMMSRQVRAKVAARRGEFAEAERLGREAVALGAQTEMLTSTADAFTDLGEVLRLAGKDDEAKAALDEAIARYERKGNVVGARRARALAGYEALAGR